jgi:hypothetical protein
MKIIKTKKGEEIFVDDEDYELVCEYTWFLNTYGYAITNIIHDGKRKQQSIHRMILGVSDSKVLVDHINWNKLDNTRSNLRLCSQSENCRNRGPQKDNTSGVKGLNYDKQRNRWIAQIKLHGKRYKKSFFCKKYPDAKDLAIQWLKENREKLHGEFAHE